MARNETTSAIVDGMLKAMVAVGTLSLALVAPSTIKYLDKPALDFLDQLDEKSKQRELQRIYSYILREKLITEHYQHGLEVSPKAKRRLHTRNLKNIQIKKPKSWDNSWRLVIFDIPEKHKLSRRDFTKSIRHLGFQHLQQSVWIHPFPCREQIVYIADAHRVAKYITYIETSHIDNDHLLKRRFEHVIHSTST